MKTKIVACDTQTAKNNQRQYNEKISKDQKDQENEEPENKEK